MMAVDPTTRRHVACASRCALTVLMISVHGVARAQVPAPLNESPDASGAPASSSEATDEPREEPLALWLLRAHAGPYWSFSGGSVAAVSAGAPVNADIAGGGAIRGTMAFRPFRGGFALGGDVSLATRGDVASIIFALGPFAEYDWGYLVDSSRRRVVGVATGVRAIIGYAWTEYRVREPLVTVNYELWAPAWSAYLEGRFGPMGDGPWLARIECVVGYDNPSHLLSMTFQLGHEWEL
jgi:hypothetical protein